MGEPTRVVAPPRGPIEVRCDQHTGLRLASAALRRNLTRGVGGPLVLGASLAMGIVMAVAFHSALWGTLYGLAMLVTQLVSASLKTRHSFRRLAPAGQLLATRYDDRARLAFTTAIGTSVLSPGSVDRVERRDGLLHLRTVPSRQWVVLPAQLLTEEDIAHLLDRRRALAPALPGGGPAAGPGTLTAPGERRTRTDDLDLIVVVDAQARRDLQKAVAAHRLRSRNDKMLVAGLVVVAGLATLNRDWIGFLMLMVCSALMVVDVVRTALTVGRSRPVGQLLRAAVTPTHLVVEAEGSETHLPWGSIRSCTVTRRAVVFVLRQGVVMPLPRSLFPQAELSELQQLVRRHSGG